MNNYEKDASIGRAMFPVKEVLIIQPSFFMLTEMPSGKEMLESRIQNEVNLAVYLRQLKEANKSERL